jgi:hypothetical protein
MLITYLASNGLSGVLSKITINSLAEVMTADDTPMYQQGVLEAALNIAGLLSDGETI